MLEDDDGLRPAAGIALGCVLGLIAWGLIAGGVVLVCVAAILAWG